MRKKTQEEFLEDVKKVHGDRYDYSLSVYEGDRVKVDIICKVHGVFSQRPNNHQSGQGCEKCSYKYRNGDDFKKYATEQFDGKYDYSKFNFVCSRTSGIIICPIHGERLQTPYKHLCSKIGCSECSNRVKKKLPDVINEFNLFYNNKYDYSKFEYINRNTRSIIICPIHGDFLKSYVKHMRGQGCKHCLNKSVGENRIKNVLDSIDVDYLTEKTFDGCLSSKKYKLKFDFFIEDLNMCIEYDGVQHFEVREFFGGVDDFNTRRKHDNIKNKFCEDNDIKLLRIPYWDFKNIEEILKREIN